MPYRSRKSRRVVRSSKFVRRRVSTPRFKSRRGSRFGSRSPRYGLLRRGRGRGGSHKRLSKQPIKSFFPDIATSILKGHHIWTGIRCNDLSTALAYQQGGATSNTFSIKMNANPNNGNFYFQPGTDVASKDILNPVATYRGRYTKYRPMGAKVTVTVFSQDNGEVEPVGNVSNIQVATPFMLYGFPFCKETGQDNYANQWGGQPANGYTADTIPQMKYGFRRISPGLGGKNMVKYTTYWDFSKIVGLTRDQYMADQTKFVCEPDDGTADPAVDIMLCLALADFTPAVIRQCTVDIKIEQYGRWEGQQLLFN